MLKHTFSKKEITVLILLILALMGMAYYQFVYKWAENAIAQYDTTEIEMQILTEQAKASKIRQMQDEINSNKKAQSGVVETYNNLKQELNALNDIFDSALKYDFSFEQATATDDAVRRVITATFTVDDYKTAKKMLKQLHDCKYRCLIGDVSVSPASLGNGNQGDKNLNVGGVTVNFNVTFYETLYNSTTTDGLEILTSQTAENAADLAGDLAASKERAENTGV